MTTLTTLFAGPGNLQCGARYRNQSIEFHQVIDGTIRTLSATNPPAQQSYKGLLFVPSLSLPQDEACNNLTAPFVPSNVTRRSDIPAFDHDLIGLAPWVTPECARAYLAASSREAVRTLVFYQPESLDTKKPPAADSAVWDLGDDGEWKKDNQYPVYAIPGPSGTELMKLLARYSGRADGFDFDIGDADNNDDNNSIINERTNLTEAQVQRSCTRLYALLDLEPEQSSTGPGIWVFVLAILGAIVLMMIFAYLVMHHVQRRRRESLQRRLVAGEVDLEYLGITRLVVPPQLLSQLPVYVYPADDDDDEEDEDEKKGQAKDSKEVEDKEGGEKGGEKASNTKNTPPKQQQQQQQQQQNTISPSQSSLITNPSQDASISSILEEIMPKLQPPPRAHTSSQGDGGNNSNKTKNRLTFSQRTCAICLDDFEPGTSLVRELPCTHIFHPECVDAFLMRDGSTCPVCKHNVLPPSFIEYQVSNLMVRREQRMRRLQRHRHEDEHRHYRNTSHYHHRSPMHETQMPDLPVSWSALSGWLPSVRRLRALLRLRGYEEEEGQGQGQENTHTEHGGTAGEDDSPVQRPPGAARRSESFDPARREMMQRRAMVLLGTPVGERDISSSPTAGEH